jgi:osmoprotectant transport system permease protein
MNKFLEFLSYRIGDIGMLVVEHIQITAMSISLAIIVGIPVGVFITRKKNMADLVMGFANVFQTLPSLALFGLIIPIMGIGYKPSVFVLFLYALLPIIKNTYLGISGVDPAVIDAGKGMGMTDFQILKMIEVPLSLPVIMGGVRISTVINIGTATLAALIGAGGLGDMIFKGISLNNTNMILAGAIPTALLALSVDSVFGKIEKMLVPKGLRL